MIPQALLLLRNYPQTLQTIQSLYPFVLCDEFQDSNASQLEFLLQIASHGRVSVVGDIDQLIYGFQGADRSNILNFHNFYAKIGLIPKTVDLCVNFRSCSSIVNSCNLLINCSKVRSDPSRKSMRAFNSGMGFIRIVECLSSQHELDFICRQIQHLVYVGYPGVGPLKPSEIAILYRNNFMGESLKSYCDVHLPGINMDCDRLSDLEDQPAECSLKLIIRMIQLMIDPFSCSSEILFDAIPNKVWGSPTSRSAVNAADAFSKYLSQKSLMEGMFITLCRVVNKGTPPSICGPNDSQVIRSLSKFDTSQLEKVNARSIKNYCDFVENMNRKLYAGVINVHRK